MKEDIEKYIRLGEQAGQHLTSGNEEIPAGVVEWMNESEANRKLFDEISSENFVKENQKINAAISPDEEYRLFNHKRYRQIRHRTILVGLSAAAMVIVAIGLWIFSDRSPIILESQENTIAQANILPGKKRAILILDADKQVYLGEQQENIINNGRVIANTINSSLDYTSNQSTTHSIVTPNHRLIVPAGGEYQLVLSDGTKVWINAGSELSYPIAFNGNTREIFLQGEAYFEVAPDKSKPFYVHTSQLNVKVTGTSFNVSAYAEEEGSHITLIEGSVRVLKDEKTIATLLPGKQLSYDYDSQLASITDADIESVVAWKNGLFLFKDEPLSAIITKLGRWYDVSFNVSAQIKDKTYSGSIRKDEPINSVLNILKLTNEMDFRMDSNKTIEVVIKQ